eukprot:3237082-Prymnesium_polylepis.3
MSMTRVFVYGSLMQGLHNSHLLASSKLLNPEARTRRTDLCLVESEPCEEEGGHTYPYAIPVAQARTGDVSASLQGCTYEVSDEVLRQASSACCERARTRYACGLHTLVVAVATLTDQAPVAQLDMLEEHPDYYRRELAALCDEPDAWIYRER